MRTVEASFPKGEEWWTQWPLAVAAAAAGVAGAAVVLVGPRLTSYFFAERLGFAVRPGGLRLRLNLLLNYLDLALMYSFTRGRPALPNVLTVREAAIRGEELLRRRPEFQRLLLKLEPRRA